MVGFLEGSSIMEKENNYSLCVFCCFSFSNSCSSSSTRIKSELTLVQFSELLERIPAPVSAVSSEVISCSRDLKSCGLSVCEECCELVDAALKENFKLQAMEVEVRRLQKQLLRQLRDLEGQVNVFAMEMEKIGGVIRSSDGKVLEESGENGMINSREVLQMREQVLNVTLDLGLRTHHLETIGKFSLEGSRTPTRNAGEDIKFEVENASDMLQNDNNDALINDLINTVKTEVEEDQDTDSVPVVDHEFIFPDNPEDYNDVIVKAEDDDNAYPFGDFSPHRDTEEPNVTKIVRKRPKKKKADVGRRMRLIKQMPIGYKRFVVSRALKRETKCVTTTPSSSLLPPKPQVSDPTLKFDFHQDALFVKDVQVVIDETRRTLTCSQCGFSGKPPEKGNVHQQIGLEKRMREHIVGTHLGGYKCHVCGEVKTSKTSILHHLRARHEAHQIGRKPRKN